jgi:hypothetical protein
MTVKGQCPRPLDERDEANYSDWERPRQLY